MVIQLTTLEGKLATAEVSFMGQSTKVKYDPLVLTTEWIKRSQAPDDEEFAKCFAELVKSWEVFSSPKHKVALTLNGLKTVPLPLIRAIYNEIVFGQSTEIEEQGKDSSDGS